MTTIDVFSGVMTAVAVVIAIWILGIVFFSILDYLNGPPEAKLLFIIYEDSYCYNVSNFSTGKMNNYMPDGDEKSRKLSQNAAIDYLYKICKVVYQIDSWQDIAEIIKKHNPVL